MGVGQKNKYPKIFRAALGAGGMIGGAQLKTASISPAAPEGATGQPARGFLRAQCVRAPAQRVTAAGLAGPEDCLRSGFLRQLLAQQGFGTKQQGDPDLWGGKRFESRNVSHRPPSKAFPVRAGCPWVPPP